MKIIYKNKLLIVRNLLVLNLALEFIFFSLLLLKKKFMGLIIMFFLFNRIFFFSSPFFTFISLLHSRYSYWLSNNEIPILIFACFRLIFTLSIFEKIILLITLIIGIKIGKIQVKHKIPLTRLLFKTLDIQFYLEEPVSQENHYSGFGNAIYPFINWLPWKTHHEILYLFLYKISLKFDFFFEFLLYSFSFLQLFINRFPYFYFFSRVFISFFLIFTNYSIFLPLVTIYSMISRLVVFRVDNNFPTLIYRLFEFTGQETKIEKVAVTRRNIKIISHWSTRLLILGRKHLKKINKYATWGYLETFQRLESRNLLSAGKIRLTSSED